MAYPVSLLAPGEEIVKQMRPHWRGLIVPTLYLILVFAVGGYVYVMSSWQWLHYFILGLGAIILVFWVIRPFLRWVTTEYVFTNRRILTRNGFIAKSGLDVPLRKVNNVSFDISVFGRMLNYGRLKIDSANAESDLIIADVPDVEHIQKLIYTLQEDEFERNRSSDD